MVLIGDHPFIKGHKHIGEHHSCMKVHKHIEGDPSLMKGHRHIGEDHSLMKSNKHIEGHQFRFRHCAVVQVYL
jgi:hypothetical protein